jgi:hypothetical protein
MLGEPRRLTHEWLVHWDLVWHSRKAREEKVRIYDELSTYTGSEYYLFEGQQYSTLPIDYIPPSPLPEPIVEMRGSALACRIRVLEMPRVMRAGKGHHALISVQNLSSRVFHPGSEGVYRANVSVSYHWRAPSAGELTVHSWDHARVDLPGRLLPGESVVMYLPVRELPPPGSYWLQPDLVEEGIAWASSFTELPVYPVDVVVAQDARTMLESAEPTHKDGSSR